MITIDMCGLTQEQFGNMILGSTVAIMIVVFGIVTLFNEVIIPKCISAGSIIRERLKING
jgi:hypothetical protein